ncbi:hypothetical protein C8Q77DRAFT_475523 [Trametes polyzona]|nr:hypothetical protein C8Q77DRAFT_475523 [Trametes polyzona]
MAGEGGGAAQTGILFDSPEHYDGELAVEDFEGDRKAEDLRNTSGDELLTMMEKFIERTAPVLSGDVLPSDQSVSHDALIDAYRQSIAMVEVAYREIVGVRQENQSLRKELEEMAEIQQGLMEQSMKTYVDLATREKPPTDSQGKEVIAKRSATDVAGYRRGQPVRSKSSLGAPQFRRGAKPETSAGPVSISSARRALVGNARNVENWLQMQAP